MAEINKHQAFEVPEPLQKRLRRLFDFRVFPDALNREISVEVDDETFEMPYPFKADRKKARAKMIIAALDIEENKQAAAVSFCARIYIGTNSEMLSPRTPGDANFYRLVCENKLGDALEAFDVKVVADWLMKNGVTADLARKGALDSDHFGPELRNQLFDRIEEIVSATGASKLLDNGDVSFLQGNEEIGFEAAS